MKRSIFIIFLLTVTLLSCQSEIEKADKLRVENKFDEAAALYQKLADDGDAYAMWRLSAAYSNGDGVDCDKAKSFELLKQAAKAGCEEAKCDLAFAYMFGWFGTGLETEKGKGMMDELIQKSNNAHVLSRYASLIFFGSGPYEEDREKAIAILNKVNDKDYPTYCEIMGDVYLYGTDEIAIDVQKSIDFYTKAFKNGRRNCAYFLQSIYALGRGEVKADEAKRMEWLDKGIKCNQTDCMVTMALICLYEDSVYKEYHNPQKGVDLLKKAARHGSGVAYYLLGTLYYEGDLLKKDDKKAFENWQKAASLKDPHGGSHLAYAYIEGVGCDKDVAKGIDVYKQAVENGSGQSANNLYVIYWKGDNGVEKDEELAKYYLLKAAELGDDWGCFNLGMHYFHGSSIVDRDPDQAYVYVKKAADMGLVNACETIAFFYKEGIGCNKNPSKAKEYENKSHGK